MASMFSPKNEAIPELPGSAATVFNPGHPIPG